MRHVVLLGIGHTNAHVVSEWEKAPIPDTELICISDHPQATYSGMLPAVLAVQKPSHAMQIDLQRLCASARATLVIGKVVGLDRTSQQVLVKGQAPISFDVLSIGIGSVPAMQGIDSRSDNLVTIKPMQRFLERLRVVVLRQRESSSRPLKIAIIGGGAAGVEICCCVPRFLKSLDTQLECERILINRGNQLIPGMGSAARKRVERVLHRQGVEVLQSSEVIEVDVDHVQLSDGRAIAADLVIWATGAAPPPIVNQLGLPTSDDGFLSTQRTLQSTSGLPIFVVGDTGTIETDNAPKAGVFAVRQGPILWENIQRLLAARPLMDYIPQRSFLRLINTGDGSAIGEWHGISFRGSWVMQLKEWIDSTFVKRYQR